MDVTEGDWTPVLDKLAEMKGAWPSPEWTWDDRFGMLASSFTVEMQDKASASAALALPYSWDSKTLETAPPSLRDLCEACGGLRARQRLLAGRAGELVLFGLWWPWGNGTNITLRLGLGQYEPMEPPYPAVRELFGVNWTIKDRR
jgi:hypothetical protein